jgi:RND superfamily putative drug exporter
MFKLLTNLTGRRSWSVIVCAVGFAAIAGYFGGPVTGLMTSGVEDFDDPASESTAAKERLAQAADVNPGADVLALVRAGEDVNSPAAQAKVKDVAERIGDDPAVARALTVYETGDPAWISSDGDSTYVVASFEPEADAEEAAQRLRGEFADDEDVLLGGGAIFGPQAEEIVSRDLSRAELLAFPILFVLSLFIFRGLVAAILPLLVGGLAIVSTLLGLRIVTEFAPLSVYALNLVTGLGLGLAIDYSLFIVSRYREEISRLGPGREALYQTLATAGRTVLFSSLTVAVTLAALLIFPQPFLYSMGVGGILVSLLAASAALVVLPAVLALLGTRVNALSPRRFRVSEEARPVESERWYRLSHAVMRRPVAVVVATSVLLVCLAFPFLGIEFTAADASVLPQETSARQVDDALEDEFPPGQDSSLFLAVRAPEDAQATAGDLNDYAARLGDLPNVQAVAPPRFVGDDTWQIDLSSADEALSEESRELVWDIRALDAPYPVEVGGFGAGFVDRQASLFESLPYAFAAVLACTLAILFLLTGSVVLPIKTLLMNVLTVSATFGILVWVFQEGRFENLLDYTSQGALDNTQLIVVLILAFGLSTDYGVFLLSRIKEARESGIGDTEAVAVGVGRTGGIITAAACLFCVAVGAFATSDIVFIKELGVGAALAVLIDSTIVRALLVPSLMKLLGYRNWWAPWPLRWLHERVGLSEGEALPRAAVEFYVPSRDPERATALEFTDEHSSTRTPSSPSLKRSENRKNGRRRRPPWIAATGRLGGMTLVGIALIVWVLVPYLRGEPAPNGGAFDAAFVHHATPENTSANTTYLDNPHTNDDPEAILYVTQNWNPGGGAGTYNDHPIGVWYNDPHHRWEVFNQDRGAMPEGASFNVVVLEEPTEAG